MFDFSFGHNYNLTQGATLVIGPKFTLGHSFYIKGMKYSHPLKGGYFKPEIILTSFNERGYNYGYNYNYNNSTMKVNCASLMLTYGNQYILANTLTFGFNFGIGYAFTSYKNTNSALNNLYHGDYYGDYSSYLFNQLTLGDNIPIAFTSSITLGYVFK